MHGVVVRHPMSVIVGILMTDSFAIQSHSAARSCVEIGAPLSFPEFPKFKPEHFVEHPNHNVAERHMPNVTFNFRHKYDWTIYSESGLRIAERYWADGVAFYRGLLPARFRHSSSLDAINLGTFNGSYQKAWMRAGYSMYGVEKADVIEELHRHGCAGHRDDVLTMRDVPDNTFDFGVLDRVFCTRNFHDWIRDRACFANIMRVIKFDGALTGMLYDWYTGRIISELASYGALTLWPLANSGYCVFTVDRALPPSAILDPVMAPRRFFRDSSNGPVFIPTNEHITASDRAFAPLLQVTLDGARQGAGGVGAR
jgi:hypothetical protein